MCDNRLSLPYILQRRHRDRTLVCTCVKSLHKCAYDVAITFSTRALFENVTNNTPTPTINSWAQTRTWLNYVDYICQVSF